MTHYFFTLFIIGLIHGFNSSKIIKPNHWVSKIININNINNHKNDSFLTNNIDNSNYSTNEFDDYFSREGIYVFYM